MYCKKCGAQIEEGALFCGTCGSKIDEENGDNDSQSIKKTEDNAFPYSVSTVTSKGNTISRTKPSKKTIAIIAGISVSILLVIIVFLIVVVTHHLICFFTSKPYKIEKLDNGNYIEYYYGDSLKEKKDISYDENNNIISIEIFKKIKIDGSFHKIIDSLNYVYYEDGSLAYKNGYIYGEPNIFRHNYLLDKNDKYVSNEVWREIDNSDEEHFQYLIEDSVKKTKITRLYENKKTISDEETEEPLYNNDRLFLDKKYGKSVNLMTEASSSYIEIKRLIEEECTDLNDESQNSISVIHYYNDKIVEEKRNADGRILSIEYNLFGEEIDSYFADK